MRPQGPCWRKGRGKPSACVGSSSLRFPLPPLHPEAPCGLRPPTGLGTGRSQGSEGGPGWETGRSSPRARGRSGSTCTGTAAATPSSRCFGTASSRATARPAPTTTGGPASARSSATSSAARCRSASAPTPTTRAWTPETTASMSSRAGESSSASRRSTTRAGSPPASET